MRYFALIDILGFGQYVSSHSLDEISNAYASMLTGTHYYAQMAQRDGVSLDYQVHSDTICVITPDDSPRSLQKLLFSCHIQLQAYFYLLRESGSERFPVRGAISKSDLIFGDYSFTTQAFMRDPISTKPIPALLGRAVVEADRWEKCQEWSGISFCPALYEEFRAHPTPYIPFIYNHMLVEYDVPLKGGQTARTLAVNPVEAFQLDTLKPLLKKMEEQNLLHPKVLATSRFVDYIINNNLEYPCAPAA